jgi:hypothetical protein
MSDASANVDFQRMIDTAVAFFLAGERCTPSLKFGKYGEHSLGAPVVVSYALSIEICLKMLIAKANGDIQGHSLKALFDRLPAESKEHLKWLIEPLVSGEGSPALAVLKESPLDEMDRNFVDWRYPYERDYLAASHSSQRRAFIKCHMEIRRAHPQLVSTFERNWGEFAPDETWAWYEMEIAEMERGEGLL